MLIQRQQIVPPRTWEAFEDLCLALFRTEWQDNNVQKRVRAVQAQPGVDIVGTNHVQGGGLWGVQCKFKNSGNEPKLTIKEITSELDKADNLQPKLARLIFATTAANDVGLHEYVRELNETRAMQQLCPVQVFGWDSIEQWLFAHPEVAERFYPGHFANLRQSSKPLHLPAASLSPYFADPLNHLSRLRQQLGQTGGGILPACVMVRGMGGVGKTQLALKYCQTYQDQYSGVWWFRAEIAELLEQECMLFCVTHGLMLPVGESAARVMGDWLGRQHNWLLVFDNVEEIKLVRAILPKCGTHHVLITSRLRDGWAGMGMMELDVLQEEQALPFLRERLAGGAVPAALDNDDASLRTLNQTLGGLPLALEQACAYIVKHQITIAEYCQRIQVQESAIRLLDRTDSEFYPRSVAAILSLTLAKLSPAAQQLLEICAWLAAEPIPEYLFTENAIKLAEELPPAMQIAASDALAWHETVVELENHALCHARVEYMADHMGNGAEPVRCLYVHPLTQTILRSSSVAAGGTALALMWATFPAGTALNQPQHWPRCHSLSAHVQRLHEAYQPSWQQAARHAELLNQLARYLQCGPGLYPQAENWQRQALLIQHAEFGEEHPATLASISNLATILWQMGDLPGARDLEESVLATHRYVSGEAHPATLTAFNNLALTLWQMGDLSAARALQEHVLAMRRQILGEEHPDTLTATSNLATTLWQMGDLSGARALQEQVLAIRRRVLGEEHPATLSSLNNLALTLYYLGDSPAAQDLMQQAFDLLCRVLGQEHPDTRSVKQNLAAVIEVQSNL